MVGDLRASAYLERMTELTISVPDALRHWVETRIAQGHYADAADYLRDLIRRDRNADDRLWLKATIDEGLALGLIDEDPRDIIRELIAEDPDLRD